MLGRVERVAKSEGHAPLRLVGGSALPDGAGLRAAVPGKGKRTTALPYNGHDNHRLVRIGSGGSV